VSFAFSKYSLYVAMFLVGLLIFYVIDHQITSIKELVLYSYQINIYVISWSTIFVIYDGKMVCKHKMPIIIR